MMVAAAAHGKGKRCLRLYFTVLYLALFQAHLMVCLEQGSLLARALRSLPRPDYETIAPVRLHEPVYVPKIPFLGELSVPLSVGKIFRVFGYMPEDTRRFQINFCSDCVNGPIHFHFDVRFSIPTVVRNSYENGNWKTEERGYPSGAFPFEKQQEFFLEFEVTAAAYFVSLNGEFLSQFAHRVPYSSVDKIQINGGPALLWKLEYTDKSHEDEKNKYEIVSNFESGMTVHAAESPGDVIEKFTVDLRCECTPQNSTAIASKPGDKKGR